VDKKIGRMKIVVLWILMVALNVKAKSYELTGS